MRSCLLGAVLVLLAVPATAQQGAAPAVPKLFASNADVTALIARAKAERRPDQAIYAQPIVQLAPYNVSLEYRAAGLNANASIHETDAELFYVVEGSGTVITGGTLKDERRTNAANLSGTGIDGGTRRRIAKGDFVLVPEKTAHWFGEIDGALVLMSLHLPHGAAATR
jgi:mannose-6-phosphate isomerase-like protein (cupin superfamily)